MSLLKKGAKFIMFTNTEMVFNCLKKAFISAHILTHPDPTKAIIVETNASGLAIGMIFSQFTSPHWLLHPCVFFSWKLTPTDRNHDVWDKKLLDIKAVFEQWQHHLEGDHTCPNLDCSQEFGTSTDNIRFTGSFSSPNLTLSLHAVQGLRMGRQMPCPARKSTMKWSRKFSPLYLHPPKTVCRIITDHLMITSVPCF